VVAVSQGFPETDAALADCQVRQPRPRKPRGPDAYSEFDTPRAPSLDRPQEDVRALECALEASVCRALTRHRPAAGATATNGVTAAPFSPPHMAPRRKTVAPAVVPRPNHPYKTPVFGMVQRGGRIRANGRS
jgi:hypothetical protein